MSYYPIDKENAEKLADLLNSMSFHPAQVCEAMTTQHRTLQQNLTRLCVYWLSTCASDDYKYDGRNEASHTIAKALMESQDADFIGNIPFI